MSAIKIGKRQPEAKRKPYTRKGPAYASVQRDRSTGELMFTTSYDEKFVADLKKKIPVSHRAWDKPNRVWRVSPSYAMKAVGLILRYYQYDLATDVQRLLNQSTVKEIVQKKYRLDYLGAVRERDNGEKLANGLVDGQWTIKISLKALKAWFTADPTAGKSFYDILGVKAKDDQAAIKTAYRRLIRQWHPDVCKEANAHVVAQRINDAYATLSDWDKRRRYDAAGKMLDTKTVKVVRGTIEHIASDKWESWVPPIRCGWITVRGTMQMGRMVVEEIVAWEDEINAQGKTRVTSWPADGETFDERWVK